MFLGFSYLLVTAWRHEPAIIPSASISHVNSTLRYSAVLIQAYGVHTAATTQFVPFPLNYNDNKKNIDNKFSTNWQKHSIVKNLTEIIDLEHSCGYLTMVCIGVRDLGCEYRDPTVTLGGSVSNQQQNKENQVKNHQAAVCISNENFHFPEKRKTEDSSSTMLQSPVETHFAITPPPATQQSKSPSPANGFTCPESTNLLCEELDQLEQNEKSKKSVDLKQAPPESLDLDMNSFENLLMSPVDENINMFTRVSEMDILDLTKVSTVQNHMENESHGEVS